MNQQPSRVIHLNTKLPNCDTHLEFSNKCDMEISPTIGEKNAGKKMCAIFQKIHPKCDILKVKTVDKYMQQLMTPM